MTVWVSEVEVYITLRDKSAFHGFMKGLSLSLTDSVSDSHSSEYPVDINKGDHGSHETGAAGGLGLQWQQFTACSK